VLRALGAPDELAHGSLRFGLGRFNTEEEIDYASAEVVRVVRFLREQSPLYELAHQNR
jgi:cysteine desulfurase